MIFFVTKSVFSFYKTPSELISNDNHLDAGYQGKSRSESSSSPISDITGHVDDDEDEYRSTIMPLTSHSENEKV